MCRKAKINQSLTVANNQIHQSQLKENGEAESGIKRGKTDASYIFGFVLFLIT